MSKKNKVVYSDIQPNAKEAGVWVNTTDGNIKIEKDGKWVDDGGSSSGSGVEYTYLDLRGFDIGSNYDFLNIIPFASFINYKGRIMEQDVHYIISYGYYALVNGVNSGILGLAIDESFMVTNMTTPDSVQRLSIKEAIEMSTAKDLYNSIPRITKEKFYSLT